MILSYDVARREGDCFDKACFSFWCEDSQKHKLKAVIVITPGSGDAGKRWMKNWEGFAAEHKCGIVGVTLTDVKPKVDEDYIDAKNGSGRALLEAVDYFESQLNQRNSLPLLLWGFSAGGEFNYEMACYAPGRVAAFVVNKGGIYYTGLAPQATRRIPALFFTGERDEIYRIKAIEGIFAMNRVAGNCNWLIVREAGCKHVVGMSVQMGKELFQDVLDKM